MRFRLLAFFVVLAALTSCSENSSESSPDAGELRVEQEFAGNAAYAEGSYSYVRIEEDDGDEVSEKRLDDVPRPTWTTHLEPGSYRLISYQRPCAGDCSTLDPPTDRCEKLFHVARRGRIAAAIRVSPGEGCTIEFR